MEKQNLELIGSKNSSPTAPSTPSPDGTLFYTRNRWIHKSGQKICRTWRWAFFSHRGSWYVYSRGPWSPMEVFRSKGQMMHSWWGTRWKKQISRHSRSRKTIKGVTFWNNFYNWPFSLYYNFRYNKRSKVSAIICDYNDMKLLKALKRGEGGGTQQSLDVRAANRTVKASSVPVASRDPPPRLWHHTRGMRGMPGSWEKSSLLNSFSGALEVTTRQTMEVTKSLHIYGPYFCLLTRDESHSGNLSAWTTILQSPSLDWACWNFY